MTPSISLILVSSALLLAASLTIRTLLARRAIRRRVEALAARMGAGRSLPVGGGLEAALAHLERATGHAQEAVSDAVASGTLLAGALDAVDRGVLLCDEQGHVVYRNEHLSGLLRHRVAGPAVASVVDELAAATGHDKALSRLLEVAGPPPRTLRIDAAPVDDGRRTLGMVAVVRDVSSDHEAVRTRGDFLADARDELGLPASTILTLADVLLEQDCPPPARHLAARIHTNASALTRVVEDLILLHRAETEPTRAGRAVPVDVMIEQALARVRDEARRRDIALATAAGPEDLSVAGDRTLLVAALTHLVRATLERSPEGSSVQVRPALVDRFAEITVEDERGVPLSEVAGTSGGWPRIDLRDGAEQPTGLGLTIARRVAANHGGTVDMPSPDGGGAALVLRLPVAAPANAFELERDSGRPEVGPHPRDRDGQAMR